MKKWIIAYLSMTVCIALYADKPLSTGITTNSTMIAASRVSQGAIAWSATTAYTQGYKVKANNKLYFAVIAGTSGGTAPSHTEGDAADGTVTWRRITPGKRNGITVQNNSTNSVYLSVGSPAISGAGIRLGAVVGANMGGTWWSDSDPVHQGPVYLINLTGNDVTNSVIHNEW